MIISHKYKYIFLKTNKTAGTSIEIALSKFCGPEDIISPITPEDEALRSELGYPGPQNHILPLSSYSAYDVARSLFKRNKKHFYNHMTASEVKANISDEVWNTYYKFCFERNPWDRCVSLYFGKHRTEPRPTISEYINSKAPYILKRKGYGLYTIDGKVVVDKICRFEELNHEMEELRKALGIPEALEIPRAKSKYRRDKRHYRDILSVADKTRISELFNDEIKLLGYEW